MAVTLFLLGQKGLAVLQFFEPRHLTIVKHVLIGRDKDVQNDFSNEIKSTCEKLNISYSFENASRFEAADILISIGWRWIIHPTEKQQLIIFHDSLLPKYRGFNPLVSALINGDARIGATALLGGDEYDTGDIIAQQSVSISYPIKINTAIEMMATCYRQLAVSVMDKIVSKDQIETHSQNEAEATYSLWRDKEDYFINWHDSAAKIKRMVDATGFPYAGAKFLFEGTECTLLEATEINDLVIENRCPGKLIFKSNGLPIIVCGTGLLRLDLVADQQGEKVTFAKKFRIRLK